MKHSVRLAIAFFLLSTLPVAFVSYVSIVSAERTIVGELTNHVVSITEMRAADFARWAGSLEQMIESIAQRPLVEDLTANLVAQVRGEVGENPTVAAELLSFHLVPHLQAEGLFEAYSIVDAGTGEVLIATDPEQAGKFRIGEPYFNAGREGTYVGRVRYTPGLETLTMHVAAPVKRETETSVAILVGRVDLGAVGEIATFAADRHETEDVYLVNAFGFFVTEPRFGERYALRRPIRSEGVERALAGETGVAEYEDYRGTPVLGAFRWLPEHEMALLAEIDLAEAFAPIAKARALGLGLLGGSIVAFSVLGIGLARRMTHPLRRIAAGAAKVGRGEFSHRIGSTRTDEFGDLARSFDRMAEDLQEIAASRDDLEREISGRRRAEERLRETLSALRESEGTFRLLAEASPVGICICRGNTFRYVNPALTRIFGYEQDQLVEQLGPLDLTHPDDRDEVARYIEETHAHTGMKPPLAFRGVRADGSAVSCEGLARLIEHQGGPAILGTITDTTMRDEAERTRQMADDIVRMIPSGMFIYRVEAPDQLVLADANPEAERLTGVRADEVRGLEFDELWTGAAGAEVKAGCLEAFRSGESYRTEGLAYADGRADRTFRIRAFRIPEDRLVVSFEDVSPLRRAEERFRVASEIASDLIYEWDIETDELRWFGDIDAALGYEPGELAQTIDGWVALIHPEDRARLADSVERHRTETEPIFEAYRVRSADGSWRHWIDRGMPLLLGGDRPRRWIGVCIDDTDRARAAEQLEASERRYRNIVELAPVGIVTVGLDGQIASCNAELARMTGYEREEMVGRHFRHLPPVRARDIPRYLRMFAGILRGRTPEPFETAWTTADGERCEGEVRVALLKREDHTWGIQVIVNDITDRKAAEAELRESEVKYRELVEAIREVIYAVDAEGIVTYASPSSERLIGYRPEELIGRPFSAFGFADDLPSLAEMKETFARTSDLEPADYRLVAKDGTVRWVRTASHPIDEGDRFAGFRGVLVDVTEARRAEEAMRVSEAQYRSLFENAALGIYRTTSDGRILAANPALVRMLGYDSFDELTARNLEGDGYEPETPRERFKEELERAGRLEGRESTWVRKDGERLFVRENAVAVRDRDGRTLFYEGTVEDITAQREAEAERRALEAQLQQTQRLESIGTLASGVAHEINNPLTGMINYAELIGRRVEEPRLKDFSEAIMSEGARVAKIVRNLLSFARQEKESHSPARISDIFAATMTLVGRLLEKDRIAIEADVPDDLPKVKCRSQQIQQVLLNLLTNARDALNERYPGGHAEKRIRVEAREERIDAERWIRVAVEDRGSGISAEALERIFDPFFTTKPRDRGTGLGLSVSYGIVRDHGGRLTAESEEGSYTRFVLDLPVDNGWRLGEDGTPEGNDG